MKTVIRLIKNYIFPRLILDIVIFYIVVTFMGGIGSRTTDFGLFLQAAIAVYCVLAFSFVYNDIVDREDDKHSPYKPISIKEFYEASLGIKKQDGVKRFENPFSFGVMNVSGGYILMAVFAVLALVLSFGFGGGWGVLITALTLVLGIVYSGIGSVRVKSVPVLDILSHALLLAGFPVLIYYTMDITKLTAGSFLIFLGAAIGSLGGSFHNQYRDFEDDQASGIKNSSSIVGRNRSRVIGLAAYAIAAILIVIGVYL